jgi:hypothetical protein
VAVAVARRQFEGEHLPLKTATRRLVKTVSWFKSYEYVLKCPINPITSSTPVYSH